MLPDLSQVHENMPEIPVNGRVLKWARDVRGLKIEDAANLLDISSDELRQYEVGAKQPLIGLLRDMSAKYQINFSSLLMPEPLPIEDRSTDYRVRHGKAPVALATIVAMEEVNEALEVFSDIANETRRLVPSLSIGTATIHDDPE